MPTLTTKITGSNNYFSLISLNINGLNSPIKRHRLTDWLHKQDPTFCCLQETHLREKDRHYLRVKGWKTIFQANGLKKQAGVAILISDKIDWKDFYLGFSLPPWSLFTLLPCALIPVRCPLYSALAAHLLSGPLAYTPPFNPEPLNRLETGCVCSFSSPALHTTLE